MFTDKALLFDTDAVTEVSSGSTVYLESVIDIDIIGQVNADGGASGSPIRDIGAGKPVYVWVRVDSVTDVSATNTSGCTITITADSEAICDAGSQELCSKTVYPVNGGLTTANKPQLLFFELSGQPDAKNRYLGCKIVNNDTNSAAEDIQSFGVGLCMDRPKYKPYNKQSGTKILG
jgi:hypothetical protein